MSGKVKPILMNAFVDAKQAETATINLISTAYNLGGRHRSTTTAILAVAAGRMAAKSAISLEQILEAVKESYEKTCLEIN